jgi:hypothetical protein
MYRSLESKNEIVGLTLLETSVSAVLRPRIEDLKNAKLVRRPRQHTIPSSEDANTKSYHKTVEPNSSPEARPLV